MATLSNALNFSKKIVQNISLDNISPDPDQPRKTFAIESIKELAENIKELGLLQPILVRRMPNNENKYILIAGERRYRSFKYLKENATSEEEKEKYSRIEAKIDEDSDEIRVRAKQYIENVIREDLNPVERADGLKKLYDLLKKDNPKLKWSEVEKRVGISEATRKRLIEIVNAPEEIKQAFTEKKITARDLKEFNKLDKKNQKKVLTGIKKGKTAKESYAKVKSKDLDIAGEFEGSVNVLIDTYRTDLTKDQIVNILNNIAHSIE